MKEEGKWCMVLKERRKSKEVLWLYKSLQCHILWYLQLQLFWGLSLSAVHNYRLKLLMILSCKAAQAQ